LSVGGSGSVPGAVWLVYAAAAIIGRSPSLSLPILAAHVLLSA